MPFTLSHAAATLPFRRSRLVPSALLMGTFGPDLEYFIRLAAGGGFGHTLPGVFVMSLPLALLALWVFHRLVKAPLVYLLPDRLRARLTSQLAPFRFGPPIRFLNIVVSILIGIATHLAWDGATHFGGWLDRLVPWLHSMYRLPVVGLFAVYGVLQYASSVAGLLIVFVWCRRWYRRTQPFPHLPANPLTPRQRHVIVGLGLAASVAGALLRAWLSLGVPTNTIAAEDFVAQALVTVIALGWWQLALWGLLGPFRSCARAAVEAEDLRPQAGFGSALRIS